MPTQTQAHIRHEEPPDLDTSTISEENGLQPEITESPFRPHSLHHSSHYPPNNHLPPHVTNPSPVDGHSSTLHLYTYLYDYELWARIRVFQQASALG